MPDGDLAFQSEAFQNAPGLAVVRIAVYLVILFLSHLHGSYCDPTLKEVFGYDIVEGTSNFSRRTESKCSWRGTSSINEYFSKIFSVVSKSST